jgi:hypothetical protein
MEPVLQPDGTSVKPTTIARAAGYAFEQVDGFLDKLGKPVGLKSYKPYHSTSEDFLHAYLGMIGIPVDLDVRISLDKKYAKIRDLIIGEELSGKEEGGIPGFGVFGMGGAGRMTFPLKLSPHSYRVFEAVPKTSKAP